MVKIAYPQKINFRETFYVLSLCCDIPKYIMKRGLKQRMIIRKNITAQNNQRQQKIIEGNLVSSTQKLSSGYRINKAADDAAGLAISEKMRKQIRGLNRAGRNCREGMDLLNVADGAIEEITDMLQRSRVLCVKAANGTLTTEDRSYINEEIQQLENEIDRIGITTKYNDIYVLQGSGVTKRYSDSWDEEEYVEQGYYTTFEKQRVETGRTLLGVTDLNWDIKNPFVDKYFNVSCGTKYNYDYLKDDVETRIRGVSERIYYQRSYYNYNLDFSSLSSAQAWKNIDKAGFKFTCTAGCGQEFVFIFDNSSDTITDLTPNANIMANGQANSKLINVGTKNYTKPSDFVNDILNYFPYNYHTKQINVGHFNYIYSNTGNELVLEGYVYGDYSTTSAHFPKRKPASGYFLMGVPYLDYQYDIQYEEKLMPVKHYYEITHKKGSIDEEIEEEGDLQIQYGAGAREILKIPLPHIDKEALGMERISVADQDSATNSLVLLDEMMQYVSSQRSMLGSYYNGLLHLESVDYISAENTQAAESKIRDTDMAKESVKHANESILLQASQSMLAQANQINEGLLKLLK